GVLVELGGLRPPRCYIRLGLLLRSFCWLGRFRPPRYYIRLGLLKGCSPLLGRLRRPRCYIRGVLVELGGLRPPRCYIRLGLLLRSFCWLGRFRPPRYYIRGVPLCSAAFGGLAVILGVFSLSSAAFGGLAVILGGVPVGSAAFGGLAIILRGVPLCSAAFGGLAVILARPPKAAEQQELPNNSLFRSIFQLKRSLEKWQYEFYNFNHFTYLRYCFKDKMPSLVYSRWLGGLRPPHCYIRGVLVELGRLSARLVDYFGEFLLLGAFGGLAIILGVFSLSSAAFGRLVVRIIVEECPVGSGRLRRPRYYIRLGLLLGVPLSSAAFGARYYIS
ncbi:hypothetical protein TYRP_018264, partial [Tyrophagus putrescentiae]